MGYPSGHPDGIVPGFQLLQACPASTVITELSRIAVVCTSGGSNACVPQFFRIGSGHQVGDNPLASNKYPANQLRAGQRLRGFTRSFAFATALRFARHPG